MSCNIVIHNSFLSVDSSDIQQSTLYQSQIGPMLVTHWGLSGPVILRLSAWSARDLHSSSYKGMQCLNFK